MNSHVASVLTLCAILCTGASAADRPNVLYISIEDIAPLMGCYDHQNDAGEFSNLAKQPEQVATVAELQQLLHGGWRAALPGP